MLTGGKTMDQGRDASYDLETLMRQYGNDVLRTAYLYVRDFHLAEDIFQDVFWKVNQKVSDFAGESSIKTWIIRITINTCKDYLKSAYSRRVVPMMEYKEEAISSDDSYDRLEKEEADQAVRDTVMELPEKYREIVVCVYFQEMTVTEAARTLNLPEGTVKSRLKRARERLKKALGGRI